MWDFYIEYLNFVSLTSKLNEIFSSQVENVQHEIIVQV